MMHSKIADGLRIFWSILFLNSTYADLDALIFLEFHMVLLTNWLSLSMDSSEDSLVRQNNLSTVISAFIWSVTVATSRSY